MRLKDMVIARKIKIYRNVFPYKFIPYESKTNLEIISKKVKDILLKKVFKKAIVIKDVKKIKKSLISRNIIEKDDIITDHSFIIKTQDELFVLINISHHLTFIGFSNDENLKDGYSKLKEKVDETGKLISFSYSRDFGFLGKDLFMTPHQMQLKLTLHLPALYYTNKITEVLEGIGLNKIEIIPAFRNIFTSCGFINMILTPSASDNINDFLENARDIIKTIEEKELLASKNYIKKNRKLLKETIILDYFLLKHFKNLPPSKTLSIYSKLLWGSYNNLITLDKNFNPTLLPLFY